MKTVLSGTRPTGKLHIGHLKGVVENWVDLQKDYRTYYFIADIHSYTNNLSSDKKQYVLDIARDLLAAGIDPSKSVLFIQSEVREHAELALYLSMTTPLSWVQRCPTFKEAIADIRAAASESGEEIKDESGISTGLLNYPILMTSDIVLYDADYVPVGEDQLAHLEISREIARRFNNLFGDTLKEPQPLLAKYPKILGPDRRKMSKSYGNCIYLSDTPAETGAKVMSMITDPAKIRRADPGNPDICNVYDYHGIFGSSGLDEIKEGCRKGTLGCVECKKRLAAELTEILDAHRMKRASLGTDGDISDILGEGRKKAQTVAVAKLNDVKKKMGTGLL